MESLKLISFLKLRNQSVMINILIRNTNEPWEPEMNQLVSRLGFWSAAIIALLVVLIDVGIILSAILFPMTTITSMDAYVNSFSSLQMLPFIPSLMLGPVFVALMLSIHYSAPEDKKFYTQLGFAFAVACAAILSLHYYIQLTVVQQGILSGETAGLWQFVTPNPHSFLLDVCRIGLWLYGVCPAMRCPSVYGEIGASHKMAVYS